MNEPLRPLRAFLAVMDSGSFTAAARRMGVSQPHLSGLVRDLEGTLGVRLLDRTTRRLVPTAAGRALAEDIRPLLLRLDAALMVARGAGRRGRVAVAAPPLLAALALPPVLARFRAAHPGVEVAVFDERMDALVARLRQREVDFAIGTFEEAEPELSQIVLARDRLALFHPAGWPVPDGPVAWSWLQGQPLVTLNWESGIRRLIAPRIAGIRPIFEVGQVATALAMVEAGLGVAVLPAYAARATTASVVALAGPVVSPPITAAFLAGQQLPPAAAELLALLRDHLAGSIGTSEAP
jgi:DNA-binding transcriptional LysR family regulator